MLRLSSKLGLLMGLALTSISCQQIEGQSLLSSEVIEDDTHAVNTDPKIEELYLAVHAPTLNGTGKSKVDVSGECFISTYPRHEILVTRNNNPVAIVDFNTATPADSNRASCVNGRFNFAVNAGALGMGAIALRVTLRAYDDAGDLVVNDTQGSSALTITR